MASIQLTTRQNRTDFFHDTILVNLTYWLDWLEQVKETDIDSIAAERISIIRAITYALNVGERAWPLTYKLITTVSPYIERGGQWEVWRKVISKAISLASKIDDTQAVGSLSISLAQLLFWQSQFRAAIARYRQAIVAARQGDDRILEARACSNLGYLFTEYGYWYRAEVLCCHALAIFDEIDHAHGLAHTHNHLGILYTWRSLWDKAEHHLEIACDIWRSIDDDNGLMYGLTNFGSLFVNAKQPEKSLNYSKEALDRAKESGETYRLGYIYLNLGLAYKLQDNLQKSETYARRSERVFRQHSSLSGQMQALENLGAIYQAQLNWAQAIKYLTRALIGWRKLNKRPNEIKAIFHLAECVLDSGDCHQARIWLDEGKLLFDENPQVRHYYRLPEQLEAVSRRLTESAACH